MENILFYFSIISRVNLTIKYAPEFCKRNTIYLDDDVSSFCSVRDAIAVKVPVRNVVTSGTEEAQTRDSGRRKKSSSRADHQPWPIRGWSGAIRCLHWGLTLPAGIQLHSGGNGSFHHFRMYPEKICRKMKKLVLLCLRCACDCIDLMSRTMENNQRRMEVEWDHVGCTRGRPDDGAGGH